MWGFIICGLAGSFIPFLPILLGLLVNLGGVGALPLVQLISGIFGGSIGYWLFSKINTPSVFTKIGMFALSAILGAVLVLVLGEIFL